MIYLKYKLKNTGYLEDIYDKRFHFKIEEKVNKEIIKELFLFYKIIFKMEGTGRKHLLMKETLINIYKNKEFIELN